MNDFITEIEKEIINEDGEANNININDIIGAFICLGEGSSLKADFGIQINDWFGY
jgi:hypothetical protein